jgi:carboxypeptidase family protein
MGIIDGRRAMGWLGALVIFLLSASMAMGQSSTGTILGTVKDPSGQVVPGAMVTARNVGTGATRAVTTGPDGSYRMPELPIGDYEIRTEHQGFSTEVISGVVLTVAEEAVENVTLQIGSLAQTVAVTGEAPLVNTTSGSLGALVDEQKISDLPLNGRNYVDLVLLQPGVEQQANKAAGGGQVGTWFSSNGAPVRSNNMVLDGAIMMNVFGAGASSATGSTLGIDGIQEWRTITNSFSAEYGLTMGSQMIIASKAGTNVLHGTAFDYLRNDVLDAANYFYVPTAASNFARIPPYKRNDFGGSLGGPIKKDKTFVFGVYEGLRERLGVTTIDNVLPAADHAVANNPACKCNVPAVIQPILAAIPSPDLPNNQFTYPFTQPTNEDYGQVRLDHNFSSADTFFTRYTIDQAAQTQTGGFPQFETTLQSRNQYLTLSENHVFSPSLLNTARFSFSRTNITQSDPPSGIPVSFITGTNGPLDFGRLMVAGISTFSYVVTAPSIARQNIFTGSDDVIYTRGRHAFKFGTLINHFQVKALRETSADGTVAFGSIGNFLEGLPSSIATGLTPGSVLGRTYHYNTYGFYAQDDWRFRPNLTFNLGLRYEFTDTVTEVNGHGSSFRNILTDAAPTVGPPFKNPSLHNFSPRLGFAWDVFGDGKTAVRGGAAMLYDIASLGFSLYQTNLVPPFGSQATQTFPSNSTAVLTLPLTFANPANSLNGVEWNLQQPTLFQYNLAIDRQLPGNMVLTVAYAGSRGIHLIQTSEGNPTIPTFVNGQPFWSGTNPRLNPKWGSDQLTDSGGDSWYNALQVMLARRLTKGLEFQGSYTYGRVIDDLQGQAGGETSTTPIYPEYVQDIAVERGPATFDLAQDFRGTVIYKFPNYHTQQGILGGALSGWQLTTVVTLQSGYPFTPTLQTNWSRSGSSGGSNVVDRPNLASGRTYYSLDHGVTPAACTVGSGSSLRTIPAGTPLGTRQLYFDPCGFTLPTQGFLGDIGRDVLYGPGMSNADFSIIKDTALTKLREGSELEFRAEFFDLFNHPNFGPPQITGSNVAGIVFGTTPVPLATAGVLTTVTNPGSSNSNTGAREVQLALKLIF